MVHLDQGSRVALLLLDMGAAFDTLDHTTLLNRFNKEFGIRGKSLNWFESYFSERTQSVVIRGVKSEPVPLSQRVPQGSVIGPKAYTMYRVRTPPGNLEYSWIFIWNFSGPGKPGEMMLFFEI